MKFKIFSLVLLTMILIENPPIISNARIPETNNVKSIKLPLIDSINKIANELKESREVSNKNLQVLKQQQLLLKD